jgi:hypothetical protein
MTEELENLINTAILMAQELQEFVDDAKESVEGGYQEDPLQATQDLLKDWEAAYAACGFSEQDHFTTARAAASIRYPDKHGMPAPGQRVYAKFEYPDRPVLATPIHADGSHLIDGQSIYLPVQWWMALLEVG